MSPALYKLLGGPILQGDKEIATILDEIDRRDDLIIYGADFELHKIPYINEACEKLLGYSPTQFMKEGPEMIFRITEASLVPELVQRQNTYIRAAKTPGFDPYNLSLPDFQVVVITKSGAKIDLLCLCAVLTYLPSADFQFGFCILTPYVNELIAESQDYLRRIKKRHNLIHKHPQFELNTARPNVIHVNSDRLDKKITKREAEVLGLLAQGLSTREIMNKLHISENTAETHRRHLLEKFDARNSAELVKKASKVFWLE